MERVERGGRMAWFGRKRLGWGLRPISWQGWLVTIVYVAIPFALGATVASIEGWLFATVFAISQRSTFSSPS